MNQKLKELNGKMIQMDISTVIIGDINTPLSVIDKTSRQSTRI